MPIPNIPILVGLLLLALTICATTCEDRTIVSRPIASTYNQYGNL